MATWKGKLRAIHAAQRRAERGAQKRARELERQAKEQAKLSAQEQARLEVETHENKLDLLVSVHKEQGEVWDWLGLLTALPPPTPKKSLHHEHRAHQLIAVLPADQKKNADVMLEQARLHDEQAFQQQQLAYAEEKDEWEKLKSLARRVLSGEHQSYKDALTEFNPFVEIHGLGTKLGFKVHNPKLLICYLKARGIDAVPSEVKTLTSTGKLSVKQMPKARFHELYQDYLCSCILRVAREAFALLPIETLLITASVDTVDTRTGHPAEQPVLSAAIQKKTIENLDFDRLDPSDALDNFLLRGDFKVSRKSGAFRTIAPLTPADVMDASPQGKAVGDLIEQVRQLRAQLKSEISKLNVALDILTAEELA
jgi:hypothetical protein